MSFKINPDRIGLIVFMFFVIAAGLKSTLLQAHQSENIQTEMHSATNAATANKKLG